MERSLAAWARVLSRPRPSGTRILLENVFEPEPDILLALLEKFPDRNCGICFDTGHPSVYSRVPIEAWLDALGSRIYQFHLHDNHGTEDEHLGIGEGTVDFGPVFEFIKKSEIPLALVVEGRSKDAATKSVLKLMSGF
jgi:sugar phosphate isomerase/epimerase